MKFEFTPEKKDDAQTLAKPLVRAPIVPPTGKFVQVNQLKELSYLKYGRPREEVEAEVLRRYAKPDQAPVGSSKI